MASFREYDLQKDLDPPRLIGYVTLTSTINLEGLPRKSLHENNS